MSEEMKDYMNVVVMNADRIALELSLDLKNKSQQEQRAAFAGSKESGYFYLHTMPKHPDVVFECVVTTAGDAISSVYKGHRIFNSAGELIRARNDMMAAISARIGLSQSLIGIADEARGRDLMLSELATGQLIDLFAERVGKSIVVTNSHSAAGAGGVVVSHE
jgi:hypothetical protein